MKDFITKANETGGDDSGSATSWGANESNSLTDEAKLVVTATGQVLSPGLSSDPAADQLSRAVTITSQTAHSYQDSGVSNSYVLTRTGTLTQPASYINGMRISFVTSNINTGASTVNVSSIGVKPILKRGDFLLLPGEIQSNQIVEVEYDSTADSSSGAFILVDTSIGNKVRLQLFESSGTYTPTPGAKAIDVTAVAGGGAGGGIDGQGAGTAAAGGGGASGSASFSVVTDIGSSYAVVIGAGGIGAVAADGNPGGTTTVIGTSLNISCLGGLGGGVRVGSSGPAASAGGAGQPSSGGDINIIGGYGVTGRVFSGEIASGGASSGSVFGGQVRSGSLSAIAYGAGGSGAVGVDVTTDLAGGDGADGVVIIKEFF